MQIWTPEDLQKHLEKGESIFLKLWKKGCGPCKLSTPAVERLEAKNTYNLTFGQICVDDHPEMLEISGSEILPAFFIFSKSEQKGKLIGFKGLEKLKAFVDEAMV